MDKVVIGQFKKIVAYEVRGETDTNEGRGGTYLVGYFTSKDVADEAANGKGVWGAPGYVNTVDLLEVECDGKTIYYLDKPIELKIETDQALKARALKKATESLTKEEMAALGIKG